jgi:hypothetical protein
MSNAHKDFAPHVRRALAAKGIRVMHTVAIPDNASSMPWANATRGYALDDNGTHRVRSYAEVLEMAAGVRCTGGVRFRD